MRQNKTGQATGSSSNSSDSTQTQDDLTQESPQPSGRSNEKETTEELQATPNRIDQLENRMNQSDEQRQKSPKLKKSRFVSKSNLLAFKKLLRTLVKRDKPCNNLNPILTRLRVKIKKFMKLVKNDKFLFINVLKGICATI